VVAEAHAIVEEDCRAEHGGVMAVSLRRKRMAGRGGERTAVVVHFEDAFVADSAVVAPVRFEDPTFTAPPSLSISVPHPHQILVFKLPLLDPSLTPVVFYPVAPVSRRGAGVGGYNGAEGGEDKADQGVE